jgi:hypothetical protein
VLWFQLWFELECSFSILTSASAIKTDGDLANTYEALDDQKTTLILEDQYCLLGCQQAVQAQVQCPPRLPASI